LAYDLQAADFADDLLGQFGLERRLLPRLAPSEAVAGRLTAAGAALIGLPPDVPVAVGTGDDFSTPLGGGIAEPGIVADVLGTAEVVGALDPRPLIDDLGLVETHRYVGSRLHYIENPGWGSGRGVAGLRAPARRRRLRALRRRGGGGAAGQRRATLPAGPDRRHDAGVDRRRARLLLRPDTLPRRRLHDARGAGRHGVRAARRERAATRHGRR